ncbi:MAG: branched-chain amino acid ABC transporter permease [Byssovorax sp.]
MPRTLRRAIVTIALIGLMIGLEFGFEHVITDAAWRQLALLSMVNVIVALSLNVINGMAGQFSIGHAGFVGVGAYTGAVVASNLHIWLFAHHHSESAPLFQNSFLVMPIVLLCSGAMAGVFGFFVGLPSLRLKGDYLAIVTLGFAEIFRLVIATAPTGDDVVGGISGALATLGGQNGYGGPDVHRMLATVTDPEVAARLSTYENGGVPQYAGPFWIFGAVVIVALVAWRLKFSGWGRALRALREDEIASAAVGVDPTRYKVTSFVIAAIGAGVAGGLLASLRDGNPTIAPAQFDFNASFDIITMVILGGSGSVTGSIFGAVFVTFTVKMIEQLQGLASVQALKAEFPSLDLNALRMVVYAAVLITLMILRPEGLFGERELFKKVRSKKTTPSNDKPDQPGPAPETEPAKTTEAA